MLDKTTSVILLLLIALLYMLPTLIGFARNHPRRGQLTIVNILFGWTLVGLVVVFVWALATPTDATE